MMDTAIVKVLMLRWLLIPPIRGSLVIAQENSPMMTSSRTVAFAVSLQMRELAGRPIRNHGIFREEAPLHEPDFHPGRISGPVMDLVEQHAPGGASSISIALSVPGLGKNHGWDRPDTNAAVGDTQIVEWVNGEYAVYNKSTGALEAGPIDGNLIWQNLGGDCYANTLNGDPIAQWDKAHHRWLLAQDYFGQLGSYQGPYYACVAVSTSPDATGAYYLYQFPLGFGFPDYPKWGIWPSGYFQTQNAYMDPTLTFVGAYVCAYNRVKLLVGDPSAEQICFQTTPSDYGLLPADAIHPPLHQPIRMSFLSAATM